MHADAFYDLIRKARKLFGTSADDEIRETFEKDLNPLDKMIFRSQAMLTLFLPISSPSFDPNSYIHQLLSYWDLIGNTKKKILFFKHY